MARHDSVETVTDIEAEAEGPGIGHVAPSHYPGKEVAGQEVEAENEYTGHEDGAPLRKKSSFLIGPHTCRALVMGVLLLGAVYLKRSAERAREQQKEKMMPVNPEEYNNNYRGEGAFQQVMHGQHQISGQGHHGRGHNRGVPTQTGTTLGGVAGGHGTRSFDVGSFQAGGSGVPAHAGWRERAGLYFGSGGYSRERNPLKFWLSLLGIAAGTFVIWVFLVRGLRRLRQGRQEHSNEERGGHGRGKYLRTNEYNEGEGKQHTPTISSGSIKPYVLCESSKECQMDNDDLECGEKKKKKKSYGTQEGIELEEMLPLNVTH